MSTRESRGGFSLTELLVAVLILVITMAGAIAGWLFVVRGERMNSIQQKLDMDVRKSLERLKAEMRLSTMDEVYFYPAGAGPYTAISFPMARDDDADGLVELDEDDHIIWDQTVVYHIWQSTPHQLRRTVFDPRNNSLTPGQRQEQLNAVVTAGSGAGTHNGANASTTVLFENLFTWTILGKGAVFDAYHPTLARMVGVNLGSFLLSPGAHAYKFSVIDKNPSSTGYKIGLDSLIVSPSGLEREGEVQTVSAQSGATASADYRSAGGWSGNYHLLFPATAVGNSMTLSMENDRWEETNFRGTGSLCDNTIVVFDDTLTPKDFVARLQPPNTTWLAQDQTLDLNSGSTTNGFLQGCAVRVLVRGGSQPDGGAILNSGPFNFALFYAAAEDPLQITKAYIAEAASSFGYSPDILPETSRQLYFGGSEQVNISEGSYALGFLGSGQSLDIQNDRSYIVSFLVTAAESERADARTWTELHPATATNPAPPGCYVLRGGTNLPDDVLTQATWAGYPDFETHEKLYAVERVYVLAPSNGTFTSQIVDTQLSAPAYQTMTWNSVKPSGTSLGLKIRAGNQPDLSDAESFSNLTAMTSGGAINPGNKRYVQFQAVMTPGYGGWYVPSLKDVTVKWTGENRLADIGGTMTVGPDYGIYELKIDDQVLTKGVTVSLTIFQDLMSAGGGGSNRLTSASVIEVEPRNTGK
ncbi:MAG TPA: prepilin-type N-terminal cleavage/methylation domain-containing protein [Kiritimatiellia bacterium]|nr:prepilin-type N-terminal cleavage/methylation domain-containing protein [Kiritimatiellia bacterium]HSA16787.1 prepilin-type N-terminal cleavage/methylation domain-containing protein [Kiritimatiellia bacterium]